MSRFAHWTVCCFSVLASCGFGMCTMYGVFMECAYVSDMQVKGQYLC